MFILPPFLGISTFSLLGLGLMSWCGIIIGGSILLTTLCIVIAKGCNYIAEFFEAHSRG